MSSKPGNTLERFLMWQYDLIVDDDNNANESLRIAEIMGQPTRRLRLTADQFRPVVHSHEQFREQVEDLLSRHDDAETSWRDFAGYAFDFIPKELSTLCEVYVKTLRETPPATTVVTPDINQTIAMGESSTVQMKAPYGFIIAPTVAGEVASVSKELPAENPKPATYHEKQLFDNLTMMRNLMHTIVPPQHVAVPKFDPKNVYTSQFEETMHLNGGKIFFGYGSVCTINRRWHRVVKHIKADKSTTVQHYVDGVEIPADHLEVALNQPILVMPAEVMVLRLLTTEFEPERNLRKQVSYEMIRRLLDKGLIDGQRGRFKLSEFGQMVWMPPMLRKINIPQPLFERYEGFLRHYNEKLIAEDRQAGPKQDPAHLLGMLDVLWEGKLTDPLKAHRWLAYIQAILIVNGITTVDDEREFTRPYLA